MSERGRGSLDVAAWAQVASAVVGVVAAVVAAVIGFQSLKQGERQSEQARTTRTLEFFATFNSQDMVNIRDRLNNEDWCARYDYIRDPDYQIKVSDPAIVSIIDFFDAVHRSCPAEGGQLEPPAAQSQPVSERSEAARRIASAGGTCDREFAEELLSPYARDLYPVLSQTVVNVRSRRGPRFGEGLVAFADPNHETSIDQVVQSYRDRECSVQTAPGQSENGANVVTEPR